MLAYGQVSCTCSACVYSIHDCISGVLNIRMTYSVCVCKIVTDTTNDISGFVLVGAHELLIQVAHGLKFGICVNVSSLCTGIEACIVMDLRLSVYVRASLRVDSQLLLLGGVW